MKIATCQMSDLQNDIPAALSEIRRVAAEAAAKGAGIVCFPECYFQGYVSDDEAEARRRAFDLSVGEFDAILQALDSCEPVLIVGLIEIDRGALFNTAAVIDRGRLVGKYRKTHPNEEIYRAGAEYPVFTVGDLTFGINICADANFSEPAARLASQGAEVIFYPLNNMLCKATAESWKNRHIENLIARAPETGAWTVSSDVVGEQDGKIAYGCSAAVDPQGVVVDQIPSLVSGIRVVEIQKM